MSDAKPPKPPSWRKVAEVLAARVVNLVDRSHPTPDCEPACPFCADNAAFEVYRSKAGIVDSTEPEGEFVSIFDVLVDPRWPADNGASTVPPEVPT